jgi:WXXGXW repeat (2 copies)
MEGARGAESAVVELRPTGMKLQTLFFALAMFSSFPAAGCTVYSAPPPDTEVISVESQRPPPPAQIEVIPASPGPEYTWIAGYHRWDGRRDVWVGGHYDRRPQRDAHYVRGHWEHRGRITIWVDGHWA